MSVFPKSHFRVVLFKMFFNLSGSEFEFLIWVSPWELLETDYKQPLLLPEAVTLVFFFFYNCYKSSPTLLKLHIFFILYGLAFHNLICPELQRFTHFYGSSLKFVLYLILLRLFSFLTYSYLYTLCP